jgi:hypothetical protein
MTHPFMAAVTEGLAVRGVASLRYQFPFMEAGSRRPDRPPVAIACVRAAVSAASALAPRLALFAGGKSFGGRMTSMAAADGGLAGVKGLVFLGFPLHPAGKPSNTRGAHLADVMVPMLFVQGTRDALGEPALLQPVVSGLGRRARLLQLEGADHSFHVPIRFGRTDVAVLAEALDGIAMWIRSIA